MHSPAPPGLWRATVAWFNSCLCSCNVASLAGWRNMPSNCSGLAWLLLVACGARLLLKALLSRPCLPQAGNQMSFVREVKAQHPRFRANGSGQCSGRGRLLVLFGRTEHWVVLCLTHLATFTMLGLYFSMLLSSAFMVLPVPTTSFAKSRKFTKAICTAYCSLHLQSCSLLIKCTFISNANP